MQVVMFMAEKNKLQMGHGAVAGDFQFRDGDSEAEEDEATLIVPEGIRINILLV